MLYEVTLTLHPKLYSLCAASQFTQVRSIIQSLINNRSIPNITAVAELTSIENIHIHCLVELKTLKDKTKFINALRKYREFGKRSISQIVNEPAYREYISKDLQVTHEVIDLCPIIADAHNVFTNCPCKQVCQYKKSIKLYTFTDFGLAVDEGFGE